jgi:two component transcriptional regulator, araC family
MQLSSLKSLAFIPNNELPPLPFYVIDIGSKILQSGEQDVGNGTFKDFVEVIWCIEGCGEIRLFNHSFHIAENDVFYYLPGEDHDLKAISTNWSMYWVCFRGPLAESIFLSYRYARCQHASEACPIKIFTEISHCISAPTPVQQGIACGYLMQILAMMNSWRNQQRHPDRKIDRILDFVARNLANPFLDINMVAEAMKIPKSTLQKMFENKVESSLGKYIRNERFQKALVLLKNTDLPICKVAAEVGYQELPSFSRLIRRGTGVSPVQFRSAKGLYASPPNKPVTHTDITQNQKEGNSNV